MISSLIEGIPDYIEPIPPDTPVFCSTVIKIEEEFRVYVVNGKIKATCQYKG
jgi:hypothetical protein